MAESWKNLRAQLLFHRFLCVRIQIDQLLWVNCWVIIHCLEVSYKQINHLRFMLVIWSPLPPNSELLLYNSLLELICFVIMIVIKISMLEIKSINFHICSLLQPFSFKNSPQIPWKHPIPNTCTCTILILVNAPRALQLTSPNMGQNVGRKRKKRRKWCPELFQVAFGQVLVLPT